MDTTFINETAQYILTIIKLGGPVTWSWGPEDFKPTVYNDMASLEFTVNGFVHKGKVVVSYNRGVDSFEVYCLDGSDEIVNSRDDVYFNELIDALDRMVEKNCSGEEYDKKRSEWLKENSL